MLGGVGVGLVGGAVLTRRLRCLDTHRKAYYYAWVEEYHGPEEVGPVEFGLRGDPATLPGVDGAELLAEVAGEAGFDGDIDDAIAAGGGVDSGGSVSIRRRSGVRPAGR